MDEREPDNNTLHTEPRAARAAFGHNDFRRGPVIVAVIPQTAHYMTRSDIYLAAILCCTIGCSDPQPETPSTIKQAEDMKPETPASEHPDKKGTVTVPPGYKVVVVHASTEAALSKSESGYWIAQMGNAGGEQSVLAELKTLTATGRPANVIWIIPTQFLKTLNDLSLIHI